jgi:aldehyde dehydrogenase (NAD+)
MTLTVTRAQELQIPATRDYQMFIDGAWVSAIDGALSEVTTPVLREHVIARGTCVIVG